ncbi:MAG: hypothetical protein K6G94_00370, partial [Kiritimatiellae bacterium]|nr:hypothetical protein [Kiritimatiellia bacterium]
HLRHGALASLGNIDRSSRALRTVDAARERGLLRPLTRLTSFRGYAGDVKRADETSASSDATKKNAP